MTAMGEWYSRNDDLVQHLLGVQGVGLCGVGSDRCYDVAGPGRDTRLLSVLPASHPDHNADLAKLTRELNKVFQAQADELLRRFVKQRKLKGDIHLAIAASHDRLYLTFAQRIPPQELARRGAKLAEDTLRDVFQRLMKKTTKAGKERS